MRAVIFGASGMLGAELNRQLVSGGHTVHAFDRELDVTDAAAVAAKISELKPEVIFNCAAYNAVDKAETEADLARRLNADAVGNVARAAQSAGAVVVHYSTGFVFDGSKETGYSEADQPAPQSVYAETKFQGEQQLSQNTEKFYLIRLNLLFGKPGLSAGSKKSFPALILDLAAQRDSFEFVADEISGPTYAPDLAKATLQLIAGEYPFGIYHLVNEGRASWYDWAKEIFALKQINAQIAPVSAEKFPRPAKRPHYSVLLNTKFPKLRTWQEATKEFLTEQA